MENYYSKIGFITITKDIPEKLLHSKQWAKSQGINFIVMQYIIPLSP
jgi:hypothetical protein